jgi:hypothetical protein
MGVTQNVPNQNKKCKTSTTKEAIHTDMPLKNNIRSCCKFKKRFKKRKSLRSSV